MHKNVLGNIISNTPNLETTIVSTSGKMDKWYEIIFSNENEHTAVKQSNITKV